MFDELEIEYQQKVGLLEAQLIPDNVDSFDSLSPNLGKA